MNKNLFFLSIFALGAFTNVCANGVQLKTEETPSTEEVAVASEEAAQTVDENEKKDKGCGCKH